MKKLPIPIISLLILISCESTNKQKAEPLSYPETTKVDTVDTYFGQSITDPYRWLEDDNSEATSRWVSAQNNVTDAYLSNIDFKEKVKDRLTQLEDYEKVGAPTKKGEYYYFRKNDGLQNQSVVYRYKSFEDEPEVFLDPNTFSEDGTTALSSYSFSSDYKYAAFSISEGGSDWRKIVTMEVDSKKILSDTVRWAKFTGINWYKDGFFYQGFDAPKDGDALKGTNTFGKVYYHAVNTKQSQDEKIYENPENPENRFGAAISDDERFLFIYSSESTSGNELFVKDLSKPDSDFKTIAAGFENEHYVVATEGNRLIIHTNVDAPNNRLISVDADNPGIENWEEFLVESENVMNAASAGGYIFTASLIDAKTAVSQYDYAGNLIRDIELPGIGSAYGFSGSLKDEELFYSFTSFTVPTSVYKFDIESGSSVLHQRPDLDFNPDDFETKQVFFDSHDGTKVPMFIVHKKGLKLDGSNPTWLYAYGGFNISLRPGFSTSRIIWLENDGVYVMANIRGGGEYGEMWHEAGTKLKKKNVFKDFIAAGEYLIREKYTSSEYLAIQGGSNGGLLIGATINMRPDLAKVAFPMVGVMDMLRYQNFTIGRAWSADYGTSEDSEEMFEYLRSYSPVHNIKENGNYPAVMVTTADHDDRVVPAHSFKYTATLQAKNANNQNPLLIRVETKAGHGAGMSTEKRIELYSDMYSFTWYNMGIIPEVAKKEL